ncbi:O-antigen ligase domain-containing protein [bacterium]|nr:MAG: O-antigen ligase domain-containing protein [bacterium]
MRNVSRACAIFYIIALISVNVTFEGALASVVRIAGIVTLGTWIMSLMETKRIRRFSATHVFFFLFFGMHVLSLLWSKHPNETYQACYRIALMVGALVVIYDLFVENERTAAIATQAGVIGCTIVCLLIIRNWKLGNIFIDKARFTADGLHANNAAFLCVVGIPLAWGMLINRTTPWKPFMVLNAAYPFIAMFALILTGSRGGFLEALPIVAWGLITLVRTKGGPVLLAALFFMVSGIIATNPDIQNNIGRVTNIEQLKQDRGSGRADLWVIAWRMFEEDPLTGKGGGSFQPTAGSRVTWEGTTMGVHNAWLETAAELGIPGVIVLASTVFSCGLAALKSGMGNRAALVACWIPFPIVMFYEHVERAGFFWSIFFVLLIQATVSGRVWREKRAQLAYEKHRQAVETERLRIAQPA